LIFLFIVNIFGLMANVEAKTVSCEEVENFKWKSPVRTVKTCVMTTTTTIDEPNITISTSDSSMLGLNMNHNQNAEFLLVQVSESYPNLKGYSAHGCSIKEVSKEHFEGLNKLKHLALSFNQIEKIFSDTFEDLVLLEKLYLRKMKSSF
jgi:Leucine rich repeat